MPYRDDVAALRAENEALRLRIKRLEEEIYQLTHRHTIDILVKEDAYQVIQTLLIESGSNTIKELFMKAFNTFKNLQRAQAAGKQVVIIDHGQDLTPGDEIWKVP